MTLFGDLVAVVESREMTRMRPQVYESMVPLLLHLKDHCPAVVTMTHSQEEFKVHLTQALSYLHSSHHRLKTWAALFIGHTICYHPQAVFQMLTNVDRNLLLRTFEDLKKDPEPGIQDFAARQSSFLQQVAARRQR